MKRIMNMLSALVLMLLSTSVTQATTIVTSIKPLQLITAEITQGITEPELLISSSASPHDYALKPSDVKKIANADLIIWFGPELETFLEKVISNNDNALQLSQTAISIREYNESEGEHQAHGDHHHDNLDPHIWLGPLQAQEAALVIYERLSEIDAENAAQYKANYEQFLTQLSETVQDIHQQLAPYREKGYYVFHDAYDYFETYFQLNKRGFFTLAPERKPGAKTLIQIRSALRQGDVKCIFSEPQFTPSVIESVTRGSDVHIGVLDPLATNILVAKGAYFEFLKGLANSYSSCLAY